MDVPSSSGMCVVCDAAHGTDRLRIADTGTRPDVPEHRRFPSVNLLAALPDAARAALLTFLDEVVVHPLPIVVRRSISLVAARVALRPIHRHQDIPAVKQTVAMLYIDRRGRRMESYVAHPTGVL